MPAPTVLRFYTLETRKFFWLFTQKPNSFTFSEPDFHQITTMPTAPTVPPSPKIDHFERPDLLQIRLFDHLLKPKMYHFQDLRSSKSPTFRIWEPRFTPNKPFWLLTEAQKVPLTGFEKFKMSHFQVLRSSKWPTFRFWEFQNVPLSGSEHLLKLKKYHLQVLRDPK